MYATGDHPGRITVVRIPAAAPRWAVLHVYPTVDLGVFPGNHTRLRRPHPQPRTAAAQVAGSARRAGYCRHLPATLSAAYVFGGLEDDGSTCRRSRTWPTPSHLTWGEHSQGRKIALIGHSQGPRWWCRLLLHGAEGRCCGPARGHARRRRARGAPRQALRRRLPTIPMAAARAGWAAWWGSTPPTAPAAAPSPRRRRAATMRTTRCVTRSRWGGPWPPAPPAGPAGMSSAWFSPGVLPGGRPGQQLLPQRRGPDRRSWSTASAYAGRCMEGADGYHFLGWPAAPATCGGSYSTSGGGALQHPARHAHVLDFQFPQAGPHRHGDEASWRRCPEAQRACGTVRRLPTAVPLAAGQRRRRRRRRGLRSSAWEATSRRWWRRRWRRGQVEGNEAASGPG